MRHVIENQYNNCVGCNACTQICPRSCITMDFNEEGFHYPTIDTSLCNNCGLCVERCPVNYQNQELNTSTPVALGVKNADENVRIKSSSGGVFSRLAQELINNSGVVFGAAFNNMMLVEHTMVNKIDDIEKLRGSKYVQSNIGTVFKEVKKELNNQRYVMFVGTPCQVAGLYSYLGSKSDKLVTCDLVCHGVPSPKLFQDYLHAMETKSNLKIIDYRFRDKAEGWKKPSVRIEFENGIKKSTLFKQDNFTVAFSKNISLRSSCYDCKFSKIPRLADITLADFWGVDNYYPDLDDDKGVSLVLLNSYIGEKWFKSCTDHMVVQQVELEKALKHNKNATGSVKRPAEREKFFKDYTLKGYHFVEKKYMKPHSICYRGIKKLKIISRKYIEKLM